MLVYVTKYSNSSIMRLFVGMRTEFSDFPRATLPSVQQENQVQVTKNAPAS
jgi:hypothetical protein